MIRAEVRYCGRVQGVGFRATVREMARGRAVAGWVRNEEDGSVFLVAEGEAGEVESLLSAVGGRMKGFIVEVRRRDGEARGERGFEVRR